MTVPTEIIREIRRLLRQATGAKELVDRLLPPDWLLAHLPLDDLMWAEILTPIAGQYHLDWTQGPPIDCQLQDLIQWAAQERSSRRHSQPDQQPLRCLFRVCYR